MPPADELPEGTDTIIEGAGASGGEGEQGGDDRESAEEAGEADRASSVRQPQANGDAGKPAGGEALLGEGSLSDRLDALRGQAGDRARDFVQSGKDRATAAIDDVVRMIEDAAGEIDAKLGAQYGDYARRAAEGIGGFGDAFKAKDVDELFGDARELVRKSPGVAMGAAAAIGFVVARLVRAGIPEAGAPSPDPKTS